MSSLEALSFHRLLRSLTTSCFLSHPCSPTTHMRKRASLLSQLCHVQGLLPIRHDPEISASERCKLPQSSNCEHRSEASALKKKEIIRFSSPHIGQTSDRTTRLDGRGQQLTEFCRVNRELGRILLHYQNCKET